MNTINRLSSLSQDMAIEADSTVEVICRPKVHGREIDVPISEVQMPGGKRMKVLKTLLTSACERDCYYCPFRAGRDMRRTTFRPEDMARVFMDMEKAGLVEGLFLSSGIAGGGINTQDKLIDTVDILRNKYKYRGYIHLKIMPGVEKDQVFRSMQLASRLSVNLEAPNTFHLQKLAPRKAFSEELLQPLQWVEEIRNSHSPRDTWNGRWPSTITQFVVGAVGETDLELLATTQQLYHQLHLKRTYYSIFKPVVDTPFENLPAENPTRQQRLYQSSFLIRDYGFSLEEMPFRQDGSLPLEKDPKLAWAMGHLKEKPLEINRANKRDLLRIPGIGPKTARLIQQSRRTNKFTSLGDLEKLGVRTHRMRPFILLDGRKPVQQLQLF